MCVLCSKGLHWKCATIYINTRSLIYIIYHILVVSNHISEVFMDECYAEINSHC